MDEQNVEIDNRVLDPAGMDVEKEFKDETRSFLLLWPIKIDLSRRYQKNIHVPLLSMSKKNRKRVRRANTDRSQQGDHPGFVHRICANGRRGLDDSISFLPDLRLDGLLLQRCRRLFRFPDSRGWRFRQSQFSIPGFFRLQGAKTSLGRHPPFGHRRLGLGIRTEN